MRKISHRFRFQLLHAWLVEHYSPCKAADVGGGKGLLAYLLNRSGWEVSVIDPVPQLLPRTFKDLQKTRTTLTLEQRKNISRIDKPFENKMAKEFDLLIGLRCVIDEPIKIKPGIDWLDSLVDYAQEKGFEMGKDKLNFAGQDTIIFSIPK